MVHTDQLPVHIDAEKVLEDMLRRNKVVPVEILEKLRQKEVATPSFLILILRAFIYPKMAYQYRPVLSHHQSSGIVHFDPRRCTQANDGLSQRTD